MGGAAGLLQPELGGGGGRCRRSLAEPEAVAQWRGWKVRRRRDAGRAATTGPERQSWGGGTGDARAGPAADSPAEARAGRSRAAPGQPRPRRSAAGLPAGRLQASCFLGLLTPGLPPENHALWSGFLFRANRILR